MPHCNACLTVIPPRSAAIRRPCPPSMLVCPGPASAFSRVCLILRSRLRLPLRLGLRLLLCRRLRLRLSPPSSSILPLVGCPLRILLLLLRGTSGLGTLPLTSHTLERSYRQRVAPPSLVVRVLPREDGTIPAPDHIDSDNSRTSYCNKCRNTGLRPVLGTFDPHPATPGLDRLRRTSTGYAGLALAGGLRRSLFWVVGRKTKRRNKRPEEPPELRAQDRDLSRTSAPWPGPVMCEPPPGPKSFRVCHYF